MDFQRMRPPLSDQHGEREHLRTFRGRSGRVHVSPKQWRVASFLHRTEKVARRLDLMF
jgi:hypothetical protein